MRLDKLIDVVLVAVLVLFSASYAHAEEFSARLNGFEELGAQNNETGAILSNGAGTLRLSLDKNASAATFRLPFLQMEKVPLSPAAFANSWSRNLGLPMPTGSLNWAKPGSC